MSLTYSKNYILVGLLAFSLVALSFSALLVLAQEVDPTPSPSPTAEASPSPSPEASPEASPSPSPEASSSPSPDPSPSPSPDSSPSPSPEASPSPSPSPLALSEVEGSPSPSPEASPESSPTPSPIPGDSGQPGLDGQDGGTGVSENQSTTTIETGNAVAVANIINVVNTNIINSEGWFLLFNLFSQLFDDIDLSSLSFTPACLEPGCGWDSLDVSNTNTGTTTNDVQVTASTGANSASNNPGNAFINTGNAFAAANVINFLNTNIIASNYLLLVLNNFSSWTGDLIFPGEAFWQGNGLASCADSDLNIENTNEATIDNNVETTADTGDNTANDNEGEASVDTGNAVAASNVLNVANTNLVGSQSLFILIRVFGNWSGNIFSLPPGVTWEETPGGISISGLDFGSQSGSGSCANSVNIANTNTGVLSNNIQVFALTGANNADNNAGNASITTGNAFAAANVINFVNTNIYGRNWVLALINVFGNWQGDLAFGQPDLWVGSSASVSSNPIRPDSVITYTLTLKNKGDAAATGVRLIEDYPDRFFVIENAGGGSLDELPGRIVWDLGTLPLGGTASVSYSARIKPLPEGMWTISNTSNVTSVEDDRNPSDNTEIISTVLAQGNPATYGAFYSNPPSWPVLEIEKTASTTGSILPGGKVDYKIVVKNVGIDPALDVKVYDILAHQVTKKVVSTSSWNLGEIKPGKGRQITYTAVFEPDAPTGLYVNGAYAVGYDNQRKAVRTSVATTTIEIVKPKVNPSPTVSPVAPEEIMATLSGLVAEAMAILGEPDSALAESTPTAKVVSRIAKIEKPIASPNLQSLNREPILATNLYLASLVGGGLDRNNLPLINLLLLLVLGSMAHILVRPRV